MHYTIRLLPALLLCFFSLKINAQEKDLALGFLMQEKNYEGVILLYDYKEDELTTSHFNKANDRVLPASTFKIFNTLLFLDLGIVEDTLFTLQWDGTNHKHKGRTIASWNKDTNLAEAFRNSTVWYYKELSKPIDLKTYKKFMKKAKYGKVFGNKKKELDFWNIGSKIGVSAKEQIRLLVRIHEYHGLYQKEHIDIVKELMIEEKTDDYILRSKTGWTVTPDKRFDVGKDLGWYIGYVETDDNAYFFAVRIEKPRNKPDRSFSKDRKILARKALKHAFGIDIN